MSIFWDRKTYGAFKYTLHNKFTVREKLCWHWYPCPGCHYHEDIIGKHRSKILFEHYHKLDNKTHLIYWRSHPQEWKQLCKRVNRKSF